MRKAEVEWALRVADLKQLQVHLVTLAEPQSARGAPHRSIGISTGVSGLSPLRGLAEVPDAGPMWVLHAVLDRVVDC